MALYVEIKVIPSSGNQKIILDKSGILKCFLKNPPEKGRANAELIKFLSKKLNLMQSQVEIVSGAISRKKRLKIGLDISFGKFLSILGAERQLKIYES